jgi:glycosyltransferase involved in cell wall biosynthesis
MGHDVSRMAVVIATRNRSAQLRRTLGLLSRQTNLPVVVVVADSSTEVVDQYDGVDLPFKVVHLRNLPAGIQVQRNLALAYLRENSDVEFVQVLDDDLIFSSRLLERGAQQLTEVAGSVAVCGVTNGSRRSPASRWVDRFERAFLLSAPGAGEVSRAGINSGYYLDDQIQTIRQVSWVLGCSMWRYEILMALRYWEGEPGYVLGEDVEISSRAQQLGQLYVDPNIRLRHLEMSRSSRDEKAIARQSITSRWIIMNNLGIGPVIHWRYTIGVLARALLSRGARRTDDRVQRLSGTLEGLRWAIRQ